MSGFPANGPGLTWDELDELADYVAGGLTGAPADRVAGLIRTDDRWAATHAALAAAEPRVRAALHAASGAPPPLPEDVAARLDAVLGEPVRAGDRIPIPHRRHPVAAGRSASAPPRSHGGTGTRRAGRPRRSVLTRVAAAVLVLVAVGGLAAVAREYLAGGLPGTTAADIPHPEQADGAAAPTPVPPMAGTPAAPADPLAGVQVFASTTDYRRDTLDQLADRAVPLPGVTLENDASEFRAEGALSGLSTPGGLRECLTAVGLVHPGSVLTAEFARFEGEPAVILLVRQASASTVVAVGPGCGVTGAEILASVEVA